MYLLLLHKVQEEFFTFKRSVHITVSPEMNDFLILAGRLHATINIVTV